jgi:hypothetical protein
MASHFYLVTPIPHLQENVVMLLPAKLVGVTVSESARLLLFMNENFFFICKIFYDGIDSFKMLKHFSVN